MAKKKKAIAVDKAEAAKRVKQIIKILTKTFPDVRCELDHENPLQLLISTILSAQCTDVRVNMVAKVIYKKYKSAKDWANAPVEEIEEAIRSTGFYKNKAKNIKAACTRIVDEFDGEVPDNLDDLLTLPGVGRKSANVVLGNAFDTPGIVCDTHMIRMSRRLALSSNSDPVKLEFDLMEIVPQKQWTIFSHLMVFQGRYVCKSRKPDCESCTITKLCPCAFKPELW